MICAITVTYARRWHLLRQALASAFSEGVQHAIVVDNGAHNPIEEVAVREFGENVTVVTLSSNTGSANAFKVGIETALEQGAQYLLLLDDDNVLEAGALHALMDAHAEVALTTSANRIAVLGFRPEHQADIAEGIPPERTLAHPDSFFSFHIADIPFKIWRRTPWAIQNFAALRQPERVRLEVAPYSGMLFHRSVIERIGLPDPKLVLYADDTEFSYRLTVDGGGIWLVPGALMRDLESSWNVKKRFKNSFEAWLCGEGDLRAYYGTRNQSYFESHCRPHNLLMRTINRSVYLAMLRILSKKWNRRSRYRLLVEAIADGEAKRLGLNYKFPL